MSAFWPPLLCGLVLAALWEAAGARADPLLFAPPSRIVAAFGGLVVDGELLGALGVTLATVALGYGISAVLGVALGVLWGLVPAAGRIIEPIMTVVYPLPRVALIPVVVIWFGIDMAGRLFLVVIGTVFDIMVNTYQGVRFTNPTFLEVARSFGASRAEMVRHVVLPAALPHIAAGLRVGIGRALIGVTVAELFLSAAGLGELILRYGTTFRIAEMLGVIGVLSLLGVGSTALLQALERRLAPWRSSGGQAE